MQTRQKLNLEYWGRVVPMCEGTALENRPWECVKMNGKNFYGHPNFDSYFVDRYELAVAVLEDRAVFVGDEVYRTDNFMHYKAKGSNALNLILLSESGYPVGFSREYFVSNFTWIKPEKKRTFELNGVKLPSPSNKKDNHRLNMHGRVFYFRDKLDRDNVAYVINKILTEAAVKD